MPGSDERKPRPGPPIPRASVPEAPQLPPTVMTEIDDDDAPSEIAGEATRTLAAPPTDPEGEEATTAGAFLGGGRAFEGGIEPPATDPPPPYIASRDIATPRGLTPPPRTAAELAQQPAPDRRERATAQRLNLARGAVFAAITVAVALGLVVIVVHLTDAGEAADGPILVVATATEVPVPVAPREDTGSQRVAPIDRTASIEELERLAARHIASGNRIDAAAVYAVLAERAPHRRAFAAAARVLSEDATR